MFRWTTSLYLFKAALWQVEEMLHNLINLCLTKKNLPLCLKLNAWWPVRKGKESADWWTMESAALTFVGCRPPLCHHHVTRFSPKSIIALNLWWQNERKKKEIFFWRREKLNSCKSVDSAGENMKLCLFSSSHFHIHFCYLGDTRRQNSQRVTVGQWNFRDMWLLVCFSNWCALCVYLPPPIECFISDEILNFDDLGFKYAKNVSEFF